MVLTDVGAGLSWNVVDDVRQLFQFGFMVNALRPGRSWPSWPRPSAGSWCCAARASPATPSRWSGFPGAAGATLIGVSALTATSRFCVAAALLISAVPQRRGRASARSRPSSGRCRRSSSPWAFCSSASTGGISTASTRCSSGTSWGSPTGQVLTLLVVAVGAMAVLGLISRPLLFASIDPDVAAARGVPVRAGVAGLSRPARAWRPPRPVRSPARSSCSPCSSCPPPPPSASRPAPCVGGPSPSALGLAVTWVGLGGRLLLALSDRLLGHHPGLRRLCRRGAAAPAPGGSGRALGAPA